MATIDLGKIRLNWRGTYVSTTTYEYNDAVYYQNSSYVYINTNSSSGNTPQATGSYWQILADGTTELTTRGIYLSEVRHQTKDFPQGLQGTIYKQKGILQILFGQRVLDQPIFLVLVCFLIHGLAV